jgi:hypothetical protein
VVDPCGSKEPGAAGTSSIHVPPLTGLLLAGATVPCAPQELNSIASMTMAERVNRNRPDPLLLLIMSFLLVVTLISSQRSKNTAKTEMLVNKSIFDLARG